MFKTITRASADSGVEMQFSWENNRFRFFTVFAWSRCCKVDRDHGKKKKHHQRSVHTSGRGEKLQFPSVIPAPWNAGIVLVTAGFQSTLKCNWTLERRTEKGRHCQGQSLAGHAIATSGLIDLYKASPPPPLLPLCLIDLGYSLSKIV